MSDFSTAEFHEGDHHESGGSSEFLANLLRSPPPELEPRPKFVASSRTLGLSRSRLSEEAEQKVAIDLEIFLRTDPREIQIMSDKNSPNYLNKFDKATITAWIAGKRLYLTTGGKRRIIAFITTDVIGDLMDFWRKSREEIASYSDEDLMARLEKNWLPADQTLTGFYSEVAGVNMPERTVPGTDTAIPNRDDANWTQV